MRSESLNVRGDNMKIFNQIRGLDDRGQEGGIFMTHGQQWRDLRRFALQQINDLAVGKKDILADIVNQEVNRFCDRLESEVKASSEVKISKKFMPSINNVIWRILTGKDTDIDDPEVRNLSKAVADVNNTLNTLVYNIFFYMKLYCIHRCLHHLIPHLSPLWLKCKANGVTFC